MVLRSQPPPYTADSLRKANIQRGLALGDLRNHRMAVSLNNIMTHGCLIHLTSVGAAPNWEYGCRKCHGERLYKSRSGSIYPLPDCALIQRLPNYLGHCNTYLLFDYWVPQNATQPAVKLLPPTPLSNHVAQTPRGNGFLFDSRVLCGIRGKGTTVPRWPALVPGSLRYRCRHVLSDT